MSLDKKALRKQIKEKKAALTREQIAQYSRILTEKALACPLVREAKSVYGYLPYNQEVLTWDFLEACLKHGKRVAVPKVYGDTMKFLWLEDLSRVEPGYCGIPEPVADEPEADDLHALVLMPGLAFDPEGHRLGYGGGFYDKFLAAEPEHPTLALCYEFQMLPHLDTDSHDIPVQQVIWAGLREA